MDINKLKSKMALYGDNGGDLATYLQISRTTLSSKMNETNGSEFTQNEILKIKEKYSLTSEEVDQIFFNSKCETTHKKRSDAFGKNNMEGIEKIWNP